MDRIFEFDNKNEIKLGVEGFDCVPILIGSEQSDGVMSLDKLSEFQGCNLHMKSVNVKNGENEIVEVKTYYTVVSAKEKKYNNDIIESFERKENCKMLVEVCLGKGDNKRYEILEYPCTENVVNISRRVSGDIFRQLKQGNSKEETDNTVELILYDKDGFEAKHNVCMADISNYILSIRIIDTTNNTVIETISKKARDAFGMLKDDRKNKIEVISNLKTSVIKFLCLKKA